MQLFPVNIISSTRVLKGIGGTLRELQSEGGPCRECFTNRVSRVMLTLFIRYEPIDKVPSIQFNIVDYLSQNVDGYNWHQYRSLHRSTTSSNIELQKNRSSGSAR